MFACPCISLARFGSHTHPVWALPQFGYGWSGHVLRNCTSNLRNNEHFSTFIGLFARAPNLANEFAERDKSTLKSGTRPVSRFAIWVICMMTFGSPGFHRDFYSRNRKLTCFQRPTSKKRGNVQKVIIWQLELSYKKGIIIRLTTKSRKCLLPNLATTFCTQNKSGHVWICFYLQLYLLWPIEG